MKCAQSEFNHAGNHRARFHVWTISFRMSSLTNICLSNFSESVTERTTPEDLYIFLKCISKHPMHIHINDQKGCFFLVHSSDKIGAIFSLWLVLNYLTRGRGGVLGCWKWVLDWTLAAQHKAAHITKDLHICEQFKTGGRKQRHFITFLKFKTASESGAFGIISLPRLNPPLRQVLTDFHPSVRHTDITDDS